MQILGLLPGNGVDINLTAKRDENALHVAARSGYSNIVRKLLSLGMDPNIRNCDKCTPLHSALEYDFERMDLFGTVEALSTLNAGTAGVHLILPTVV